MRKDLEYLFISKVRIGVLKLFLTHQDVPYFLREVVRQIREEVNAVRRELLRLEEIGFVKSEPKGNKIYYTVNTNYTYYPELVRIIYKSFGLGAEIIRSDKNIGNIKYCFLTSSYTRGIKNSESDVDLIVDFENLDVLDYGDNYYNLKFSLEIDIKNNRGLFYSNHNDYFLSKIPSDH